VADHKGNRKLAEANLHHLSPPDEQDVVAQNEYGPRLAKIVTKYDATFPKLNLFTIREVFGGWQKAQAEHFSDGGVFDQIYTQ
jgi:sulfate/thiosulfate transport system substrate-binding protein